MKRLLAVCLLSVSLTASAVFAQTATVDVWPAGKMPGHGAIQPEVETLPAANRGEHIDNVSHPTLAIFPVASKNGPAPAMIVCPGGAYKLLAYNKEGAEIAAWLNSIGIEALVLKYRVPDNREGALQDIQRAFSLARANAAQWKIDPKRLGVIGFSAGGNLAAVASTQFDGRTYPAIDDADKESCRPDFVVLVYPAYLDEGGNPSPRLNLKANIPPTLILHNEDDTKYVAGSKAYHAALDAAKLPNKFVLYPTGGHGYGLHCTKAAAAWPQAAADWLHSIGAR